MPRTKTSPHSEDLRTTAKLRSPAVHGGLQEHHEQAYATDQRACEPQEEVPDAGEHAVSEVPDAGDGCESVVEADHQPKARMVSFRTFSLITCITV